jgi:hypothetical protein
MFLTDICRTFHPTGIYSPLSTHGAFFKMDHTLGQKTSLNKYIFLIKEEFLGATGTKTHM